MSKGKLTRQELGWLLTQEAQGAAERLRKGVSALTQAPPAPGVDASGVDATLSALDDAMKMLANLHQHPVNVRGRRGRIDLASMLWEVAPEARVSIEPGSGTEVFGDESDLRRMLHVMLGHGGGGGSSVTLKREGDEVVLGVVLGPESSANAAAERAWLARMALRYGGRHELEGSTELLALPAEGVEAREDVAKLRKELDEARAQGEAYARELAAVWSADDEALAQSSTAPPQSPSSVDRHGALARFAGGVAAALRSMLSPVGRELGELRGGLGSRRSSPDLDGVARLDPDERIEGIRRRLLNVQDFVGDLAVVGESDPAEQARDTDIVEVVRHEARSLEARATRSGVMLRVRSLPDESTPHAMTKVAPHSVSAVVRLLIGHAIGASPRGSSVGITVHQATAELGVRLVVDDPGTIVSAAARKALLELEVDPGTFGRPTSVALFAAAEIASAHGARLEVSDAPVDGASGGGLRVSVVFPR